MNQRVERLLQIKSRAVSPIAEAYLFGLAGVLMFSGGIVATRMSVLELPPIFVGAGRAAVAGLLSLVLLGAIYRCFWCCFCFSGVYCCRFAMD